jgi:hypothetical protein
MYVTYLPIIFLLPVFFTKYKFPRELLFILLPLLFAGLLNVLLGNNEFKNFFKIFANICINIIFYRYVMEYYEYNVRKIFDMYLKGCYVVAILGLIQLGSYLINFAPGYNWKMWSPLNKWGYNPGGLGIRVNSTFSEPANLGLSFSPAFFISLYTLFKNDEQFIKKTKAIVIILVFILSFSSLAYVGIFLSIMFFAINFGLIRYLFIAIPVTIFLFNVAYNNATEFKQRVDGLKALFIDDIMNKGVPKGETKAARGTRIRNILTRMHGSSFVLYNNTHVVMENFKKNPLFGSGLGSQEIAFQNYNLNYIIGGVYKFNVADANSMLLRIISEVGIMGILFTLIFVFKFYISKDLGVKEDDSYWLLANALLILIIAQLLRQGNYTFGGFFMYGWMYYYNFLNYKNYRNSTASLK